MRAKRSIKDSLKEYLNWCVSRLLLGGSRNDTVRDMVDAISDEIASGGGVVSQDQLDQTVQDITKSYGIADQTVLTSAESYTDQKIADVVDGSPEALDTLYELAKALGDDSNFATTVMDQIGQKLPTTTFENFIDNKAWTKDNLTKLSQLINNINSIKAGTRVESMDVNLASMSSYLRYDLFDANTTGTKPGNLTTGFLLTFSWDNGGWGAQIAISNGNIDGAIFLRTIKDSESDKIWGPWVKVWNSNNFNPDNKFGFNATQLSDLNNAPNNAFFVGAHNAANAPVADSWSNGFTIAYGNNPDFRKQFVYAGEKWWTRGRDGTTWLNWAQIWDSRSFNPANYLNANKGLIADLNTATDSGVYYFSTPGSVNTPEGYGSLLVVTTIDNGSPWINQFAFGTSNKIWHRQNINNRGWNSWTYLYDSGNFNPENYLPLSGGSITGGLGVSGYLTAGVLRVKATSYPQISFVNTTTNRDSLLFVNGSELYWRPTVGTTTDYQVYHSGNLGNATTSKAGLMSAADKTKLDGLSGGGLNIPAYIFPGDPSKVDSSASSTHITSILGTAIDLLDAFNNGRVFISKTVTFNEVQVPSDITYSLLKSIDPDNPTIFQIIMSTVVWGHYIEITIDFENNEYQAINNTINGSISVNTSGTSN